MKVDLAPYAGKSICVACSGGRDSMALLHYLYSSAAQYNINFSALNCDHAMRGEESARDSAFVIDYCKKLGIPLLSFKADGICKNENMARFWRVFRCYTIAHADSDKWAENFDYQSLGIKPVIYSPDGKWRGCDDVATAHHMDDNAETVLFNLARGTGLSGMCGIQDSKNGYEWSTVHPLVSVSRKDIDEYVAANNIPYVDDSTNFSDDYTRNYIRHNVLPALEKTVPGAARAIYRFSRLAAEDEEYFARQVKKIVTHNGWYGYKIAHSDESVIFKRAALYVIERYQKKDYTSAQAQRLYELQFAENGKKFEFLGLTAFKEEDGIAINDNYFAKAVSDGMPYAEFYSGGYDNYFDQIVFISTERDWEEDRVLAEERFIDEDGRRTPYKILKCDGGCIPDDAVVRTMRQGDKFKKFGGGTKNLGDFFTDRKIPVRLRSIIPVIASGNNILMVCGVEISDEIKVTGKTQAVRYVVSADYSKL